MIGLVVPLPVLAAPPAPPPTTQIAVKPVIAAPPFAAGAVKATLALASPAVTALIVGAPGTVVVAAVGVGAVGPLLPLLPPPQAASTMIRVQEKK